MKQYIITLLLLGISMGAWAKDYVFKTSGAAEVTGITKVQIGKKKE